MIFTNNTSIVTKNQRVELSHIFKKLGATAEYSEFVEYDGYNW